MAIELTPEQLLYKRLQEDQGRQTGNFTLPGGHLFLENFATPNLSGDESRLLGSLITQQAGAERLQGLSTPTGPSAGGLSFEAIKQYLSPDLLSALSTTRPVIPSNVTQDTSGQITQAGKPITGQQFQQQYGASSQPSNVIQPATQPTTQPAPQTQTLAAVTPQPEQRQQRTLIDIANSRSDVITVARAQGGDPFIAGTPANSWLNNWWNTAGKTEFPNVDLIQPGQAPTQQLAPQPAAQLAAPVAPTTPLQAPTAPVSAHVAPTEPTALPKDVYTTTPTPDQVEGKQFTSLRDIYDARPDLQQAFPGGAAGPNNEAINQWWNEHGRKEYPNVTLIAPDDYRLTPGLQDDFQANPIDAFKELYKRVYEETGAGTVADEIKKVQDELKTVDEKYTDDISAVNENPWLTEGVRVGRIRKIQDKYEMQRAQTVDRLSLYQGLIESARQEAKFVATGALNAFQTERAFEQSQLEFLADQAQREFQNQLAVAQFNKPSGGGGSPFAGIRELQGGLFDLNSGQWIVQPQAPQPTQAQFTVAGYATRVEASDRILTELERSGIGGGSFAIQSKLANFLKGAKVQSYEQAQRDFINSVLRRESGAAIAPSEFDSAKLQYFFNPGDTLQTLQQKQANRQQQVKSLIQQSGPAYTQSSLSVPSTSTGLKSRVEKARQAGHSEQSIEEALGMNLAF